MPEAAKKWPLALEEASGGAGRMRAGDLSYASVHLVIDSCNTRQYQEHLRNLKSALPCFDTCSLASTPAFQYTHRR